MSGSQSVNNGEERELEAIIPEDDIEAHVRQYIRGSINQNTYQATMNVSIGLFWLSIHNFLSRLK